MCAVTVSTPFVAQHYLAAPDPGPEGELRSHRDGASVEVAGDSLNEDGCPVDVDALTAAVETDGDRFPDGTRDDPPAFAGKPPGVEHLARTFGDRLLGELTVPEVDGLRVRLREYGVARAARERAL